MSNEGLDRGTPAVGTTATERHASSGNDLHELLTEIAPDGTRRRMLRYERLGPMSRRDAADILAQKLAAACERKTPARSRVTFRTLVNDWQATVLPMYKPSTQKNHRISRRSTWCPSLARRPFRISRGRRCRRTWRISRRQATHPRRSTTSTMSWAPCFALR